MNEKKDPGLQASLSCIICRPSTKPICSGEIMLDKIGLSLLAIKVAIILYIALQRAIGLKPWEASDLASLGSREKRVEFKPVLIFWFLLDSSTTSRISWPRSSILLDRIPL